MTERPRLSPEQEADLLFRLDNKTRWAGQEPSLAERLYGEILALRAERDKARAQWSHDEIVARALTYGHVIDGGKITLTLADLVRFAQAFLPDKPA